MTSHTEAGLLQKRQLEKRLKPEEFDKGEGDEDV